MAAIARGRRDAARLGRAAETIEDLAHDLRTPLTAILGFAEIVRRDHEGSEADAVTRSAARITDAAEYMLGLTAELLDAPGGGAPRARPVRLDEVVSLACDLAGSDAGGRRQRIDAAVAPVWVIADPAQLLRAVVNLLANAIEHAGDDSAIEVTTVAREADRVRLLVDDRGPGIAPSDRARIFQRYTRVDVERRNGHGVGLAIASRAAGEAGGSIGIETAPGGGARFWLELPRSDGVVPRVNGARVAATEATVLYIEDSSVNAELVGEMLSGLSGVRLLWEATGADGLATARRASPDLILLDPGLPDTSGVDLLARLAADDRTKDVPVVVVSANPRERDRAYAAGATGWLSKPFVPESVTAAVRSFAGPGTT